MPIDGPASAALIPERPPRTTERPPRTTGSSPAISTGAASPADSTAAPPRPRTAEPRSERRDGPDERVDTPEEPSADPDPLAPADPVVSANTSGIAPAAEPIPNATAKAPTRPTYRAKPDTDTGAP